MKFLLQFIINLFKFKKEEESKENNTEEEIKESKNTVDEPKKEEIIEESKETILLDKLKSVAKLKDYTIFEDNSKNYNLNIWFIRSNDPTADIFNDTCVVFWKDLEDKWIVKEYQVTTDPGLYWMTKTDYRSVAILVEGQYRGVYSVDIHKKGSSSAHEALCQRLGTVKVYRDGNKDIVHDFDVPTEVGAFGINCHRPSKYSEQTGKVHASSAGCLVWRRREDHDNLEDPYDTNTFMGLCRSARDVWGNKFSITLCLQSDIDSVN